MSDLDPMSVGGCETTGIEGPPEKGVHAAPLLPAVGLGGDGRPPVDAFLGETAGLPCIRLVNTCGQDLTDAILHAGTDVHRFTVLPSRASLALHVRPDVECLALSAQYGRSRFGLAWRKDASVFGPRPSVVLSDAAEAGDIVFVLEDTDVVPDIKLEHAGTCGRIVIQKKGSASPRPDRLIPPEPLERLPDHPHWLTRTANDRLLLFAGREMTLGRSGDCVWQVHRRDAGGGIVAYNGNRKKVLLAPDELDRKDVRFPISRVHACIRWLGGSAVEVRDGDGRRRSSRGVVVNGLLLDTDGFKSASLPAEICLGRPHHDSSVHIQLGPVEQPDGRLAICMRQAGNYCRDLAVWAQDGLFRLARNEADGLYPTWFKREWDVGFQCTPRAWTSMRPAESEACDPVVLGHACRIGESRYEASAVLQVMLCLDRVRRS